MKCPTCGGTGEWVEPIAKPSPAPPDPRERPEVEYRLSGRGVIQEFACCCGWTTAGAEAMVAHLRDHHGATHVVVSPERPRRLRL